MKLSVIIPTKNRAYLLENALDSIVKQSLQSLDFEVIIIDNGSIDETKDLSYKYMSKIKNLRYFYDSTPGLHVGRHLGLKESKADILVYLDDDVELFPNHLENVLKSFEDNKVVLVGGKNLPSFETKPPLWLMERWKKNKLIGELSILDLGDEIKEIKPNYVWGCNFSIRKSILVKTEGFHPDSMPQELIKFRGDGETYVTNFIKDSGYKVVYNPDASVYHYIPKNRMTEKYFCKRTYNQGISDSYSTIRKYNKLSDLENRRAKKIYNPSSLDDKIKNAYIDGYVYHQTECCNDINLMRWVLKENYYV